MPTFSTNFVPPPPLALTLEADLETSSIALSWPQTALLQEDFGGYRLSRRIGTGDWVLLASYSQVDEVEYTDFSAPINATVTYRLVQASLDAESNPSEASTSMSSRMWWVVVPSDASLTFPIPKVRGVSITSPKVQEEYSPIGRRGKLVIGDVVQAEEGSLSFLVMPDNPGMVALLRAVQARMDGELLLKAPDGEVHSVRIGSITRAFTSVEGLQELSLPFTGIA